MGLDCAAWATSASCRPRTVLWLASTMLHERGWPSDIIERQLPLTGETRSPRAPGSVHRADARLVAGRSPSHKVACCASLLQRRASVACAPCTPTSCVRMGADPALGPRLHEVGPRSAVVTRLGSGAHARQPLAPTGAARCPRGSGSTCPPASPRLHCEMQKRPRFAGSNYAIEKPKT